MKTITPCAAMLLLMLNTHAWSAAPVVHLADPVLNHGLHIGDVITRQIDIDVAADTALVKTSLPVQGSRSNGIELVNLRQTDIAHGDGHRIGLALDYQVFAHAIQPVVMRLPELRLQLTSNGSPAPSIAVPGWAFWFSPLVISNSAKAAINMQPQFLPPPVDTASTRLAVLLFACMALAGLARLVYINADKRWLPFMGGAFAQAHRRIKRIRATPSAPREALFHVHAAFNQVHGANCFAHDLDHFLVHHPRYERLRREIAEFFERSNAILFVDHHDDAKQVIHDLKRFSKQLRNCERGLA